MFSMNFCKRCYNKWPGRTESPIQCPKCKRTDWDSDDVKERKNKIDEKENKINEDDNGNTKR